MKVVEAGSFENPTRLKPLLRLILPTVESALPLTDTLIFDEAELLTIYPLPAASAVRVPSFALKKLPAAALKR
ncbi:MAG TPA: hypothetical protein DC017_12875 [Candidatus Wallbacteria bacterium]|nr:hypothetical protein [Candidatus Wallbacteria bacterium]